MTPKYTAVLGAEREGERAREREKLEEHDKRFQNSYLYTKTKDCSLLWSAHPPIASSSTNKLVALSDRNNKITQTNKQTKNTGDI